MRWRGGRNRPLLGRCQASAHAGLVCTRGTPLFGTNGQGDWWRAPDLTFWSRDFLEGARKVPRCHGKCVGGFQSLWLGILGTHTCVFRGPHA